MAKKISDRIGVTGEDLETVNGNEYVAVAQSDGATTPTYSAAVVSTAVLREYILKTTAIDKTADFTLALNEAYTIIYVVTATAGDITGTIPVNSSVAFDVGTIINVVLEDDFAGANSLTITGETITGEAVTVNNTSGGSVTLQGDWAAVSLHKVGTNEWKIVGDFT